MAKNVTTNRKFYKLVVFRGLLVTLIFFIVGALAWWVSSFTTTNVHNELAAQEIFFPAAGSSAITALPSVDQTQMNKYAGQQLLTGDQAKVYADNFIAVHLQDVAGGKTYAQVSILAQTDPTNATLQKEASTLFQGETLRGLLLGDAYAFWTVGRVAEIVALVAFVAGAITMTSVLVSFRRIGSV